MLALATPHIRLISTLHKRKSGTRSRYSGSGYGTTLGIVKAQSTPWAPHNVITRKMPYTRERLLKTSTAPPCRRSTYRDTLVGAENAYYIRTFRVKRFRLRVDRLGFGDVERRVCCSLHSPPALAGTTPASLEKGRRKAPARGHTSHSASPHVVDRCVERQSHDSVRRKYARRGSPTNLITLG